MTEFSTLRIRTGSVQRMRVDAEEELATARASRRTDRWMARALPEVVAEEWPKVSAKTPVDAAEAASKLNINAGR